LGPTPVCRGGESGSRGLGNVADAETRTLSGRRPMDIEKLTDRLDAPLQGSRADGLELTLASLWERRAERLGAVPILVCHDEVAVECGAEQAADVKGWLDKTMIDGMDAIMTGPNEVLMLVEVEARVSTGWGGGD
jgi:DNA polymerase I-like protein with 3'-5' exonuclease and polymerase domains